MFPQFFGVPQFVVRSGLWANMKPSVRCLYVSLLHESERRSTRQFKIKDSDLERLSGLATRTISDARKKLQELGLILYRSGAGNIYTYTICNPETGSAFPGEPDVPVKYVRKCEITPADIAAAVKPTSNPKPSLTDRRQESYGLPGVFGH
jgi:hypothetical protein